MVVALHAHGMKQPIVDGTDIDHFTLFVEHVDERQEEESLKAIQVEVFGGPVTCHHDHQVVEPEALVQPL